jgi:hypothetical protein
LIALHNETKPSGKNSVKSQMYVWSMDLDVVVVGLMIFLKKI